MTDLFVLFVVCSGFFGVYFAYLLLKFLRLSCKALRIWINLQLYGKADDYSGFYERKRDERK